LLRQSNSVHSIICRFFLSDITLLRFGMISARYLEHPLRRCKCNLKKIKILQEIPNFNCPKIGINQDLVCGDSSLFETHFFFFFIRFRIADLEFCCFSNFRHLQPFFLTSRKRLVTISLFLNWLRSSSQFRIKQNRG
jgi:hypothetical protein